MHGSSVEKTSEISFMYCMVIAPAIFLDWIVCWDFSRWMQCLDIAGRAVYCVLLLVSGGNILCLCMLQSQFHIWRRNMPCGVFWCGNWHVCRKETKAADGSCRSHCLCIWSDNWSSISLVVSRSFTIPFYYYLG